jgi:peptidoglycan/xylan/chitin deacetylase (PgdA/CDA1 family)
VSPSLFAERVLRGPARWCTALLAVTACGNKIERKDFGPRFFSTPGMRVQCSKGVDRGHEWKHDALAASLATARDHGVVLHTYGHASKLDLDEYAADFEWAARNGVPLVTFAELAAGHAGAGWAFTVDDDEVDIWYSWRERLRQHRVKLTFFVSGYWNLTDPQKQQLRELANDGHDIEAHGTAHENAVDYVAAHGVDAYVRDEVMPSKDALVRNGYPVVAFAYPYGAHTAAIDDALLREFKLLRTTGAAWCLK